MRLLERIAPTSAARDAGDERLHAELARALARTLEGEVRFDAGSRALYATDASNYRQVPIGVVIPKSVDDVRATVAACHRRGVPLLSRGGGTSLAGQCCNTAVVLDFSKYLNRILALDPQRRIARVQPGCVLDTLRNAAEEHHLTFAPDPSTHNHNTLGGMIGNNSCGVHSVMGGRTADNVLELTVLTYDGHEMKVGATDDAAFAAVQAAGGRQAQIYRALRERRDRHADEIRARYPRIPRRVSGYSLDELLPENGFQVGRALAGSEGTCITVLEATLRLVPSPPGRVLLVIGYPDVYEAGDHVVQVLEHGPLGLEGIDRPLTEDMRAAGLHVDRLKLLPQGKGWLLAEFGGGNEREACERAEACMRALDANGRGPQMRLFRNPTQQAGIWEIRESGLGATAHASDKATTWPGWEDAAVPPQRVGEYLRTFRSLLERYGYDADLYGHFGDGCIHTRMDFDLASKAGAEKYRAFVADASDLVLRLGGSLSGEHGDGQSRGALLEKMFGPQLIEAFHDFKRIWDPDWKMNPGKVIEPYAPTENLRLQAPWHPPKLDTYFPYPDDGHDFSRVSLRCVGVGECRREKKGTMCPSYRATREEMHSTRGRARLLFEMLRGDPLRRGWADPHVHESLELCLSCKGCKSDCPVHVDMATYKAEFMAHYYRHHRRPRTAYAFGWIDRWARLASIAPGLANFAARAPALSHIVKSAAGIDRGRTLPLFAPQTFRAGFRSRSQDRAGAPQVLLWTDTFNNHFHPETAQAAVEVLERAGFQVDIPRRQLCCGRPLYEFGMLDTARERLQAIVQELAPQIDAQTPVLVLEPACASVFRDELPHLLHGDERAQRLARQTYLLDEFVCDHRDRFEDFPKLSGRALVHAHCHHKALRQEKAGHGPLEMLGMDVNVLDSGCCGMAGSFGFDAAKVGVAHTIGELVLLPAVREAADADWIVADGFSCREQIAQYTERRAIHPVQAMAMAVRGEQPRGVPEAAVEARRAHAQQKLATRTALAAGALAIGLLAAWRARGTPSA